MKESIALAVSAENNCPLSVRVHTKKLEKRSLPLPEIEKRKRADSCDVTIKTILKFCVQASKDPHALSEENFKEVKSLGFSEKEILEMLTVMDMYTGYSKIIVALGIHSQEKESVHKK
jgi:AhpD family alkylhydroperoxidase